MALMDRATYWGLKMEGGTITKLSSEDNLTGEITALKPGGGDSVNLHTLYEWEWASI